ncbi:hypothetical protein M3Y94_00217100 [Aphelenchoides besseyi]|nr:hypothetical protein M3Y94_00217100 [Aphelenchoides besseyi]KAI6236567.1 BTB domain-containing protein [Aphelenchoides besseyi]
MANFFRRFAEKARSKSRSKSPVKRPTHSHFAHYPMNGYDTHWTHHDHNPVHPSTQQRLPPQIKTQYVDENVERFHPQSISAYSTWQNVGLHELNSTLSPNGWAPHHPSLLPPLSANTSSTEYVNANSQVNTLNPLSRVESMNGYHHSNSRLAINQDLEYPDQIDFGSRLTLPQRLRSESPQKSPREIRGEHRPRSRSPKKPSIGSQTVRHTFDYTYSQCKLEGCSAAIIVDDSRFLVCKHQLSHVSEFFRTLFLNNHALPQNGVKQLSVNEYTIVVSSLRHPPQSVQFQWFLESIVPAPVLRDLSDDILETCMRLSKRFAAKGLEVRCAKFIRENVNRKPPMTALCWLNWVLKHRFDRGVQDACVNVAARLPLVSLEKHRQMITEKLLADLLAMKLRACYRQTANAFYTIHQKDHFHVDVEKCPRCSRQREQGRVRITANPCQKLIGCDRCLKDLGCEIEKRAEDLQAYYHHCNNDLLPFTEETEDCVCQSKLYNRRQPESILSTLTTTNPIDSNGDFDGEAT